MTTFDELRLAHASARNDEKIGLVQRAATALAKRGPEVDAVLHALRGDDAHGRGFALAVLLHRRQFPRVFLDAGVEAVIRGEHAYDFFLSNASRWHGAASVLDAMTLAVDANVLRPRRADLFEYYVRRRADEDAKQVESARRFLRWALWQAHDAPPGARSATEPAPERIVQLIGWNGSGRDRGAFARALDEHLRCGRTRAEAQLDRTLAHPGCVALELLDSSAEPFVRAVAPTGVMLRSIAVRDDLAVARQTAREIRAALSRSDVGRVRPDLDPLAR